MGPTDSLADAAGGNGLQKGESQNLQSLHGPCVSGHDPTLRPFSMLAQKYFAVAKAMEN